MNKVVYNAMIQRHNGGKPIPMELSTYCDAPAGSGLGSSSALSDSPPSVGAWSEVPAVTSRFAINNALTMRAL